MITTSLHIQQSFLFTKKKKIASRVCRLVGNDTQKEGVVKGCFVRVCIKLMLTPR